jgi:hypothetical protein
MRFTVGQLLGGRPGQWANRKPLPVCWTGFFEDATSGHLYRHHSKVRRQVESSAAGRRHQRADAAGGPGGSCPLPAVRPCLQRPRQRPGPHRSEHADPAPGVLAGRAPGPGSSRAAAHRAVCVRHPEVIGWAPTITARRRALRLRGSMCLSGPSCSHRAWRIQTFGSQYLPRPRSRSMCAVVGPPGNQ